MYIQMPVRFSARVLSHGRRRSVEKAYSDSVEVDVPEIGLLDAPVAVSWVTRHGGAVNGGYNTREVLYYEGRTYGVAHGSKSNQSRPLREQIRMLFEQRFGQFSTEGAKPFGTASRFFDVVDSRNMDRVLFNSRRLLSGLLIVDSQLYSEVDTPVYILNRNDNFNGAFNYSFAPANCLNGGVQYRYYAADQFDQLIQDNAPERLGFRSRDKMKVEVLIPEAVQFDAPAHELLNTAAYVLGKSHEDTSTHALLSVDDPDRTRWDLWNDLLADFRQARDTWDEGALIALSDSLREFVRYTALDFPLDYPRWSAKAIRDNIKRWDERPISVALDLPAANEAGSPVL
ncbi:hypothetical protein [Roseibium sp. RKSG952]|uniref:hypothetical protein n=1 Tax=Roseibium sp. RKSG952 TaxID=2529384 RepID=UPI0012BB4AE0|nr:hypothetical protein [Roseibium sp. RKSG952]MTH95204.1 hypothetical protein [Roseibium sp. RKSG952]